ncbi:MAG: hypothetical protein V1725_02680 [archaeon]
MESGGVQERKNILYRMYHEQYKKVIFIPLLILLFAAIVIAAHVLKTGDFINKGVTLKGGITLAAVTSEHVTVDQITNLIKKDHPDTDLTVRLISESGTQTGFLVEVADITEEQLIQSLSSITAVKEGQYSIEVMGSSLGGSFFKQTIIALIIAFIFMSLVVFIYFRLPIPSIAIISAALMDIIVTIAILDLFGFVFSIAGIAALLMLIGYSIDTDIVLSVRVLKRKVGTLDEKVISAFKTGVTMTCTALSATLIAFFMSGSPVIKEIMLILTIGLVVDIIATWLFNAPVLKWYVHNRQKAVEQDHHG